METKETDFVSTMSRTIECNHKTVLYLQMFYSIHKIISIIFKISASALFLHVKHSLNVANVNLDIVIKYILI